MLRSRVSSSAGESGMRTGVARSPGGHVQVLAVEAQHVVDAGPVGGDDLARIERVDAEGEALALQEAHDVAHVVELPVEGAAEVDHVGAALPVVLRRAHHLLAGEVRHVVDLGEDPDVVGAVLLAERRLSEVLGQVPEVGGPLLRPDAPAVLDRPHVALAQARDDDALAVGDLREVPGDPRGGHEGGDRDAEHRHLVRELRRHALERRPERRLGELAGDEQGLGHGDPGILGAGARAGPLRRAGRDCRPSPTCWACPPCGSPRPVATAPPPRGAWRARSRAR